MRPRSSTFFELVTELHDREQCLAGDAAPVEADPTELFSLDDRDPCTELSRADSGDIAAWSSLENRAVGCSGQLDHAVTVDWAIATSRLLTKATSGVHENQRVNASDWREKPRIAKRSSADRLLQQCSTR